MCANRLPLLLVTSLIVVAGSSCAAERAKVPQEEILLGADTFELYSLDPARGGPKPKVAFHGWKVLGKTAVKDKKTREKLIVALGKGMAENDGVVAGCFNPRHGIRAVKNGKTVDLVICFECYSFQIFEGKKASNALTTRSPAPTFNKVLTDAKVPLPRQPK